MIVRRARAPKRRRPPVTDDLIRRIERGDVVSIEEDEPLDLDDIRDEEERFWDDWDDAEEWGA